MKTTISKLTSHDLNAVDELMIQHGQTLGFLPRKALRDYLEKGGVLGAKTGDGKLIAYLLYGIYPDRFRIAQLCVSKSFQGRGIARQLLENLKNSATTQKFVSLNCRCDFPAHNMWPKLGFVHLDERPGRSSAGHPLARWHLTLAQYDQSSLFQAKTSDETLDVVIDAQIFFDLYKPDSHTTKLSKALLSDWLMDLLALWITDELFNEIGRNNDPKQRERLRNRAYISRRIEHDLRLTGRFEERLRTILPSHKPSQESDIRQLAKAAASDVKIFVTRDQTLLKKAKEISDLTDLQILSPTDLIIRLHELSKRQSYAPDRVSGPDLEWRRLTADDLTSFPITSFLDKGERQGQFREKLELFFASPNHYKCELLRSGNDIVAIRVLTSNSNKILTVPLARVTRSADRSLFGRFLIADTISKAVEKRLSMAKFEATALTSSLIPDLWEMGFTKHNDNFMRFCFARCLDREKVLSAIAELCPEFISNYRNMPNLELERYCSPLSLEEAKQKSFLVPVRPGYAMSLVDRHGSANDLFGGKTSILLRWDNVYYRKKTHHKILQPPARILWYVSGNQKQIIAASHLDEVEIGTAKALFKKFKRFGILEWNDIYKMCAGDPSNEIMALKFSHTFPFRKPISLDTIRAVFRENGTGLSLQSPVKLSMAIFHKLFQLGYPNRS